MRLSHQPKQAPSTDTTYSAENLPSMLTHLPHCIHVPSGKICRKLPLRYRPGDSRRRNLNRISDEIRRICCLYRATERKNNDPDYHEYRILESIEKIACRRACSSLNTRDWTLALTPFLSICHLYEVGPGAVTPEPNTEWDPHLTGNSKRGNYPHQITGFTGMLRVTMRPNPRRTRQNSMENA